MSDVRGLVNAIKKETKKTKGADGSGDIMIMSDKPSLMPRLTTGCISFDAILGGGLPIGRIIEIYGEEGSGKTTVTLQILKSVQQAGGVGVFIDVENAIDIEYAENIGVDIDSLIISQPDSGEEAMDMIRHLLNKKAEYCGDRVMVIIVDSAAALASNDELSGKVGDLKVSPVARLLSMTLRRLKSKVNKSGAILIFTNQMRANIGKWHGGDSATGGKALKFYSAVRIELALRQKIKDGDDLIGQYIRIKTVKNKTYPPFKEREVKIIWGKGIDAIESLFAEGCATGIISKKGSWFQYGTIKAQGEDDFIDMIADNTKSLILLERQVHNRIFSK